MYLCLGIHSVPFMLENKNQTVPEEEKENDELESTRNDNEALNRRQATARTNKENSDIPKNDIT